MAKMLGQDLFTQSEFDKFKKEYDEFKIAVELQSDEIHKIQQITKASLALSCLTIFSIVLYFIFS